MLACLVNPYGAKGLLFPLTLFTRISGQAQVYSGSIGEFLSLFEPGTPWTILKISYMTLLCVTACSFLLNWKNVNPTHLILCAGFAYLSVKSKRNINLFAVTAYPIVLYNLEGALLNPTWKKQDRKPPRDVFKANGAKYESTKARKRKRLFRVLSISYFRGYLFTRKLLLFCKAPALSALLAVVLVTIFFAFTNRLFIMENKHKSFGLGAEMGFYPTVCIEWIKTNRPKGPLFNSLGVGGYLIHALYPDYKVFIDGRLEVHPETLYRRYTEAVDHPEDKWDALQEDFGFGWAILSHSAQGTHRLIRYLYNRPDWELVSIDSAAVVFVEMRKSGNNFLPIDFEAWTPEIATCTPVNGFKGPLSCLENLFNRPTPWTLVMPFELFSLGNLFMTLDRPEKAAEIFQIAVKRSPGLKALHNNLGLSYLRLEKWDEAIGAFKEAIDLAPRDAAIQSNLGVAYGQKALTQKAISAFKKAATLDNDYEEAFSNLGAAYWQGGRLDEAIAAYKRAVALRPDFAEHYHALAVLYYKKGDRPQATSYARRAKEAGHAKADALLSELVQD